MSPAEPPRLGALEQQVVDILWDHQLLTIREIIEHLPRQAAYTTIATVLGNLERKDMVMRHRDGHTARYTPRRTREQHAAWLMEHALASSHDREASMLHFVKSISPDDLELLRAHLAADGDSPTDDEDEGPSRT